MSAGAANAAVAAQEIARLLADPHEYAQQGARDRLYRLASSDSLDESTADVLVPALVPSLRDEATVATRMAAASVLTEYARRALLGDHARTVGELAGVAARAQLETLRHASGDDALGVEYDAGVYLELLGAVGRPEDREVLEAAGAHERPWIATWGAIGLTRLGVDAREPAARAAADSSCRSVLFDRLDQLDALDVMPAGFRTQQALAEAVMVRWLMFPTELDAAPHSIELAGMTEIEGEWGRGDLYVYRFQGEPDSEWLVGWSGPFVHDHQPTTDGHLTFSSFELAGSQPDDALVRGIAASLLEHN